MRNLNVFFPSEDLKLEGRIYIPGGTGIFPAVLVCHPHPLYGGSMENNVINTLCQALANNKMLSFKFNFRGTGHSEGVFENGLGEQTDVISALDYISSRTEVDASRIGLAGYSAGSAWGTLAVCHDNRTKAVVAISPPLSMFDYTSLAEYPKPKLLIAGSQDKLIPVDLFAEFCRKLYEPKQYEVIDGADHSWWYYERQLAARVATFLSGNL